MKKLILIVLAFALAACSRNDPQDQVAQAVQQQSSSSNSNTLLAAGAGAAAGYILGKRNGAKQKQPQVVHVYHSTPVVHRTVIVRKYYRSRGRR